MFYFKIGLRNIVKNIRKTLLTMATIIVGMAALLIFSGSNSYMFKNYREGEIRSNFGHFQIYSKGFLKNGKDHPFDYLITNYKKVEDELKKIPGVKFIAPRLSFNGLISGDKFSTVVMGIAGNPVEEKKMNSLPVTNGNFISSDNLSGIVAGSGLLKKLSGRLGDDYTIMTTMKGGGINGMDGVVKGVRKGYGEFDQQSKMFVLANIKKIESVLNVGESAGSLIIMLSNTQDVEKTEPLIRSVCKKLGLEYKRWDQLAVYYKSVKAIFDVDLLILTIIILAILVFIIANTMSMNLMERIREIGTIRALGTTRTKISKIFLAESTLIGMLGSISGTALGLLIAFIINSSGGIYHQPSAFSDGYTTLVVPETGAVFGYVVMFILVSVISAFATAVRASKIAIADALRWI